jgi:hypothetical protein
MNAALPGGLYPIKRDQPCGGLSALTNAARSFAVRWMIMPQPSITLCLVIVVARFRRG